MKYVGFDVACEKHSCCILDEAMAEVKAFEFTNDRQGFEQLLKVLTGLNDTDIKIGLESTGIYGDNLVAFLRRNGYQTCTFNPLLIKKSIQSTTLRKTKTDKSDAKYIAAYLARTLPEPDPQVLYHISELKSLTRSRFSLVQDRAKAKTRAKRLLCMVFPEYQTLFADVFGASSMTLLKIFQSAEMFSKASVRSLSAALKKASRGRFGTEKARQIVELARSSVGRHSGAMCLELRSCLADIESKSLFIAECDAEIASLMQKIDSPITTIKGIGLTLGATILSEIGDIHRFSSSAKLLSFAGLEPSIYQSGKYSAASGSMVKRGSPYLRYALILAARSVSVYNPDFALYFSKKRSEGKHYNVACSHVAKKLVRTIFAILKNNTPYSPNYAPAAA